MRHDGVAAQIQKPLTNLHEANLAASPKTASFTRRRSIAKLKGEVLSESGCTKRSGRESDHTTVSSIWWIRGSKMQAVAQSSSSRWWPLKVKRILSNPRASLRKGGE